MQLLQTNDTGSALLLQTNDTGSARLGASLQLLLQWKGNKYYIF